MLAVTQIAGHIAFLAKLIGQFSSNSQFTFLCKLETTEWNSGLKI